MSGTDPNRNSSIGLVLGWVSVSLVAVVTLWRGSFALRQLEVCRLIFKHYEISLSQFPPLLAALITLSPWVYISVWGGVVLVLAVVHALVRNKHVGLLASLVGMVLVYFSIDLLHGALIVANLKLVTSLDTLGPLYGWGYRSRTDTRPQPSTRPASPMASAAQVEAARVAGVPPETDLDLGGVTMHLILIPPGEFVMGSPPDEEGHRDWETPLHTVRITNPFYLGVYEVTQAEYGAVMGRNPSEFRDRLSPVETVSWDHVSAFCRKVSERTGRTVRLPTEAEWEYACRAGTTTPFNTGTALAANEANYHGRANFGGGPTAPPVGNPTPVGSYPPNAWGLHDMHGNVSEWCADWMRPYPGGMLTGLESRYRVTRGGCWDDPAASCRSAARSINGPGFGDYGLGFRVAMDVKEARQ